MLPPPQSPLTHALSPEQAAIMQSAGAGFRRARKAAGVARVSGWMLAVFAIITALGGLSDPFALGVAVALCGLAWSELAGARGVDRFRPCAGRRLVANQLLLLGLIVAYSGVNTARALLADAPDGLAPTGDPQVDKTLGEVGDLVKFVSAAIYITIGVVGVPVQALMALYHARRARQMRECLAQFPQWAVDVSKAA